MVFVPPNTDDTGTGQDGTPLDEAFFDGLESNLVSNCTSATNPTVTPRIAIDEVVAARGSMASVDARLDVSINENGTLKPAAVQNALAGFRNLSLINCLGNDTFRIWPLGDALAPTFWVLSGAGAAILRTGNGLADTNRKHGPFAARLTSGGGADAVLTQTVVTGTDWPVTSLRGRYIAFGARVKTTSAGGADIRLTDGASTSVSNAHTGSASGGPEADGWEWLFGVHQISSSGTNLQLLLRTAAGGVVAYWSGITMVISDVPPVDWVPAIMTRRSLKSYTAGNVAVGTLAIHNVEAPGIVTNISAIYDTAPTGTAANLEVESWDGAAFTTMLAGGLSINATQGNSVAPPGGTYARRCLDVQGGTTRRTGAVVRVRLATDDGGNTGAGLSVGVDYQTYDRLLDQFGPL